MDKDREYWVDEKCTGDACIEQCCAGSSRTPGTIQLTKKSIADKLANAVEKYLWADGTQLELDRALCRYWGTD